MTITTRITRDNKYLVHAKQGLATSTACDEDKAVAFKTALAGLLGTLKETHYISTWGR